MLSVAGPLDNAPLLRRHQQRLLSNPLVVAMGAVPSVEAAPSAIPSGTAAANSTNERATMHDASSSTSNSTSNSTSTHALCAQQQWLPAPLNPSVHIPTLERLNDSAVLLRIAHQWAASEGPAPTIALDLRDVLPVGRTLVAVIETTLTGVVPRSSLNRKHFGE